VNSRANYRTKEIRLLFVACSLIAVTAISAIAQDKDVAEVLAGGCFKALEVKLEEGRTEYKVDVGDFPMHRGLAVEVKVFNSTEADLDLAVVPSCGCTTIKEDRLKIPAGRQVNLSFFVTRVLVEKEMAFRLASSDKTSEKRFNFNVTGRAVDDISWSPKNLRVSSRSKSKVPVEFKSVFDGTEIESVELLSGGCKIDSCDKGKETYIVEIAPDGGWTDTALVFVVRKKSGANSFVSIPVVNPDATKIALRSLFLTRSRDDQGLFCTNLLLKGEMLEKFQNSVAVTCETDSEQASVIRGVKVISLRQRSSDLMVVSLSIPSESLDGHKQCRLVVTGLNDYGNWRDSVIVKIHGD